MNKIEFYRFRKFLQECNIADSRIDSLHSAISALHSSVSKLDNQNRKTFLTTFEDVLDMLNQFARQEDCFVFTK